MSVAVLPSPSVYPDAFARSRLSLSSSESDSDAGYGTPTDTTTTVVVVVSSSIEGIRLAPADSSSEGETEEIDLDLTERIVKQVEWYFSDENLLKDSFLMKHISRNQLGYVSLKLVASLRKVKTITKDWKLVQESLKHSRTLVLNEERTKVRRTSPAPQVDYTHISKTLLITDYPEETPNLADLEQYFGQYGEVAQVRVLLPGRAIPLDIKPCKLHHPALGRDVCILVELENEQKAKEAHRKIREELSWRDGMKVHFLSSSSESKNFTGNTNVVTKKHEEVSKIKSEKKKRSKAKEPKVIETQSQLGRHRQVHSKESSLLVSSKDSYSPSPSSSREGTPSMPRNHQKHSSPASSCLNWRSSKCSPELTRKYLRPDAWSKDYNSDSGMSSGQHSSSESPKMSPEPTKRFFSSRISSELSWRSSDKNSCVIRQPHGPDETRGFKRFPLSIAVQSY